MYTRIIKWLFCKTRSELHTALIVLVYAGTYAIGFTGLALLFPLIGWEFNINFEMSGYFIGCIGSGELIRGVVKLFSGRPVIGTACAGATTIGIFWLLMVFKWGDPMWGVPIAAVAGAFFYLLLAFLMGIEQRKINGP